MNCAVQSAVFLTLLLASIVLAHGEAGGPHYPLPRLMGGGGRLNAALRNHEALGNAKPREFNPRPAKKRSPTIEEESFIGPRQASCGPGVGSCGAGLCCSSDG